MDKEEGRLSGEQLTLDIGTIMKIQPGPKKKCRNNTEANPRLAQSQYPNPTVFGGVARFLALRDNGGQFAPLRSFFRHSPPSLSLLSPYIPILGVRRGEAPRRALVLCLRSRCATDNDER